MIPFNKFFLLESPDHVKTYTSSGLPVTLYYEQPNSYSFGFLKASILKTEDDKLKGMDGKLIVQDESAVSIRQKMHGSIIYNFLHNLGIKSLQIADKNEDTGEIKWMTVDVSKQDIDREDEPKDPNRLYIGMAARDMMVPCGRIWVNNSTKQGNINVISFWDLEEDVNANHIKQIMNWFLIDDYDNTYLEFLLQEGPMLSFTEFSKKTKPAVSSLEDKEKAHQQRAMQHLIGGGKAEGFGSQKEHQKSQKLKTKTTSEYKRKLDPYSVRGESFKNF